MATSPLPSALLERMRISQGAPGNDLQPEPADEGALPLGLRTLDQALPDGGLPRRGVVELCAPSGLGRLTHLALAACRAAQREEVTPEAPAELSWCAWVDPTATLYAPGVAQRGVALSRLLVIRPTIDDAARVAVRLVASGVFAAIVIDRTTLPGVERDAKDRRRWSLAVRRLALASEQHACSIILLSDLEQARREALPTRMRLELTRPRADRLRVHLTKERRGRLVPPFELPLSELRHVPPPAPVELAACRPSPEASATG